MDFSDLLRFLEAFCDMGDYLSLILICLHALFNLSNEIKILF